VVSQRWSVGKAAAGSVITASLRRCCKKIASATGSLRKQYNAAMLAEAVCKLMGFSYAPSQEPEDYWRHGHSTESDFIYVTTQSLTHDALKKLADEVGPDRTLLLCCKAFNAREAAFPNLTIKKIPHTV
jgi:adenine-specific DNA-methyltransferase